MFQVRIFVIINDSFRIADVTTLVRSHQRRGTLSCVEVMFENQRNLLLESYSQGLSFNACYFLQDLWDYCHNGKL